ncbi:TPA: hypothetical protein JI136_04010 [Acinetobacter baumannii]|uniref:hypothetical protein n=2 Tax=Acinetobacter baumannii TaxID=470 RepID=UPI0003557BAB|nr:hypothetical protein [Acinetobacter baumannii]AGQ06649.1 hypothetical protein BJAB0715_02003 [Acinetobacter baumannii BJAB0715]MDB0262146.1 hypothetical protein [Acinetobacter baumannii]MDB0305723.1 hypothetical protein [Acinetobacter baumannii]MDC5050964.1 hypothetical protein [Acinetobacter baumannii]TPR92177.1 hypothetical protein FJV17_00150 [Acinetobacter baumannii]
MCNDSFAYLERIFMNILSVSQEQFDKCYFERHCKTLAMGLSIPISDTDNKGIIYIDSYDEMQRRFNLSDSFKNLIKNKYGL